MICITEPVDTVWHKTFFIDRSHCLCGCLRDLRSHYGPDGGCSDPASLIDHVELIVNGHWHRPPVGMRADQASHLWVATVKISGDEIIGMGEKLVPRK